MTTFSVQSGRVYWNTPGGSHELKDADEIDGFLAILDRGGDDAGFRQLNQAAQAAGYPPAVSSLIATKAA